MLAVKIFDGGTVRDDITFEAEIISQALRQPVFAAGDGNPIVIIVRTHHAEQPRFPDRRFERREQNVFDFPRRGLGIGARFTFARAFAHTVYGEVFGGRGYRVVLLHASDHLDAHSRGQVRILAVSIFDPSPALVAGYVERRGVNVGVAQRAPLDCGDAAHLAHQLRVPRMAHAQL